MAAGRLQGVGPAGQDPEHRGLRLELPHAVRRCQLVQVVHELVGVAEPGSDRVADLRCEPVGLQPDVGVAHASARRAGVVQQARGDGVLPALGRDQAEAPAREALPAGVLDLDGQGVRAAEQLRRFVDAAGVQGQLGAPGQRVRREREPAGPLDQHPRPLQVLGRQVVLAAQQP